MTGVDARLRREGREKRASQLPWRRLATQSSAFGDSREVISWGGTLDRVCVCDTGVSGLRPERPACGRQPASKPVASTLPRLPRGRVAHPGCPAGCPDLGMERTEGALPIPGKRRVATALSPA